MTASSLRTAVLFVLLAGLAVATPQRAPGSAPDAAAPLVILLSWDGTRHDFPARADTPALDRMQREGARAARLIPVFPTNTFPNHASLATGAPPDVHGIVANSFVDARGRRFHYSSDADWFEAEPLWVAAERQGVRAAAFFWVGSETDWRGVGASYRRAPFHTAIGEAEKVDQILAWLDLPAAERPRLIVSWWHGGDGVAHRHGPDAPQVARQLAAQDAQLARLLDGLDARRLWDRATLIVTSDHGMAVATRSLDPGAALAAAGIGARVIRGGGMGYVWLDDPARADAARAALEAVEGLHAYRSDALPAGLRSTFPGRSGHLTVLTEPPYTLYAASRWQRLQARALAWLGRANGVHGYRAEHPDMAAIFYALGRGVPRGLRLGDVRAIDVAPTAAALLGIEPPAQSEGAALLPRAGRLARSEDGRLARSDAGRSARPEDGRFARTRGQTAW